MFTIPAITADAVANSCRRFSLELQPIRVILVRPSISSGAPFSFFLDVPDHFSNSADRRGPSCFQSQQGDVTDRGRKKIV